MSPETGALGDVPRVRQSAVHGALAHVRVEHVLADAAQGKEHCVRHRLAACIAPSVSSRRHQLGYLGAG